MRAATELAPKGTTVETFELDGIPSFNQDEEQNQPAKVKELKRRIREANAVLFVTPEYNWSVSGVLKNAIDWASRPHGDSAWNGKPAAIMGATTGAIGTARAQNHLRQILVYLNMFPINQPEVLISHAMDRFDQEGNLTDVPTRATHHRTSAESHGLDPAYRTEMTEAVRIGEICSNRARETREKFA